MHYEVNYRNVVNDQMIQTGIQTISLKKNALGGYSKWKKCKYLLGPFNVESRISYAFTWRENKIELTINTISTCKLILQH